MSVTRRSGFTLIELLIVITIILVILAMTASAVNFGFEKEKVGSAAQQVRSMLEGARDRAIRSNEPRGVRFLLDPVQDPGSGPNNNAVIGAVFVAPNEAFTDGTIQLERANAGDTRATIVAGSVQTAWWQLKKRGLLFDGLRIRIPNDRTGSWYTVNTSAIDTSGDAPPAVAFDPANRFPYKLAISPAYRDPADNFADERQAFKDGPVTYGLELPPRILPDRAALFPSGTVMDLRASSVPQTWRLLAGSTVPIRLAYMDVMFSPRGTVIGPAASAGVLHFCFTTQETFDLHTSAYGPTIGVPAVTIDPDGSGPEDAIAVGDRSLLTLFTRTGAMASNELDPTDVRDQEDLDNDGDLDEPNGLADDPYRFAETSLGAE